ncbi:MAG: chalcone isomerase family protein [Spirochaetales bacterium]|nr:chalcone isomerase family protein [Spirochaetales bacterium]
MKKTVFCLIFTALLFPAFAGTTIAGVSVGDSVSYEGQTFNLNGAGIRTKVILKLYVGSLYTTSSVTDPQPVLAGPVPSVIRLDIISKLITSELMKETIEEGFDKAMSGNTVPLRKEIDDFIAIFSDEITKGDQFTFVSLPGTGVIAYKGERKLAVISNDRFRRTLFTIWLGEDPADAKLKKAMLNN